MTQNYGALAARILLQPIEEVARLLFGKMNATNEGDPSARMEAANQMRSTLYHLMKLASIIGLIFVCFGVRATFRIPLPNVIVCADKLHSDPSSPVAWQAMGDRGGFCCALMVCPSAPIDLTF